MNDHWPNDTLWDYPGGTGSEDPWEIYAASNPSMVAHSGSNYGTNDPVPIWNGSPESIDIYTDQVNDWAAHTRIPKHKQGPALFPKLPAGPKQRLRQELNMDRLGATNWRTAVSMEDHIEHRKVHEYQPALTKHAANKPKLKIMKDYYTALCKKEAGTETVKDEVVEMRMEMAMGEHYTTTPSIPNNSNTVAIPEGDHQVFGTKADGVKYGEELSFGANYLIEMIDWHMLNALHILLNWGTFKLNM